MTNGELPVRLSSRVVLLDSRDRIFLLEHLPTILATQRTKPSGSRPVAASSPARRWKTPPCASCGKKPVCG